MHPTRIQRNAQASATFFVFPIHRGTYHKRVHGIDPWNLSMFRAMPRGQQILEDAQRRLPCQWIALDDDLEDWPESTRQNLIACDGSTGLSSPNVQRELRERLQRCHEALSL